MFGCHIKRKRRLFFTPDLIEFCLMSSEMPLPLTEIKPLRECEKGKRWFQDRFSEDLMGTAFGLSAFLLAARDGAVKSCCTQKA